MQCPYGCNTEIEKIELKIDPSRTLKEGEFVNDDTGPGRIIELYYEKNSDGDLEYIHICKEFQKILDYQDQRTGLDIIRNKIFEKNYDADFNATELDPQIINEIFGSSIKQNEIDAILTDYEKLKKIKDQIQIYDLRSAYSGALERKLIENIQCIKCHNVYTPIIELGNLYLSEAKFYPAIQIFNQVLRWNRYEPISNIGKAEVLLQSESDEKHAGTLLLDCKNELKELDSMLTMYGYVGYDNAFVISKINYLLSIIDMRWKRYTNAKKHLQQSLLKLEKDWINFWFDEHELKGEISSKIIQKKFKDKTGIDSTFLIEPHIDLLRHVIDIHVELGKIPGFSDVTEKGESLQKKYSKLVTNEVSGVYGEYNQSEDRTVEGIGDLEQVFPDSWELDEASAGPLQQWIEEKEMLEKYENDQADEYYESLEHDEFPDEFSQRELDDMTLSQEEQAHFMPESEEDGDFIEERDFEFHAEPSDYSDFDQHEYDKDWKKEKEEMEIEEWNNKQTEKTLQYLKEKFGFTDEEIKSKKYTMEDFSKAMDLLDKDEFEAEQAKNQQHGWQHNPNLSTWGNAKNFLIYEFDAHRADDEIDKIYQIANDNSIAREKEEEHKKILSYLKEKFGFTDEEIKSKKYTDAEYDEAYKLFLKDKKIPKPVHLPPLVKEAFDKNKEINDNSTKLSLVDYSTPKIQITKLSDDEMIASIEIAFRKLIRRKLLNEKNWEQLIPYDRLKEAKERLEEANLKDFTTPGNDWLDYIEIKDYEKIFCQHCSICSLKFQKIDKKTGKKRDGYHKYRECGKSNWDLYFKTVFNNQINVLKGDLQAFRDIRNSVSHHSGKAIGKFITPEGRETLVSLYTKWNKFMCKDEDKSRLR
jgi:hypothetical protein